MQELNEKNIKYDETYDFPPKIFKRAPLYLRQHLPTIGKKIMENIIMEMEEDVFIEIRTLDRYDEYVQYVQYAINIAASFIDIWYHYNEIKTYISDSWYNSIKPFASHLLPEVYEALQPHFSFLTSVGISLIVSTFREHLLMPEALLHLSIVYISFLLAGGVVRHMHCINLVFLADILVITLIQPVFVNLISFHYRFMILNLFNVILAFAASKAWKYLKDNPQLQDVVEITDEEIVLSCLLENHKKAIKNGDLKPFLKPNFHPKNAL